MGILKTVESMAMGTAAAENAKVAGGLMEELQQRPEGVSAVIQSFHRHGLGSLVEQWSTGQTQPLNQTAIENGLAGSGIIERVVERTGLPEGVVRSGLAVVIPVLVHHMVSNSHISQTGEPLGAQPEPGGVLQSVLQRIL